HRLARRLAGPLEADETALQLLVGTTRAALASRPIPSRERERTHARHQEIVDATKIALVSQPAQRDAFDASPLGQSAPGGRTAQDFDSAQDLVDLTFGRVRH